MHFLSFNLICRLWLNDLDEMIKSIIMNASFIRFIFYLFIVELSYRSDWFKIKRDLFKTAEKSWDPQSQIGSCCLRRTLRKHPTLCLLLGCNACESCTLLFPVRSIQNIKFSKKKINNK